MQSLGTVADLAPAGPRGGPGVMNVTPRHGPVETVSVVEQALLAEKGIEFLLLVASLVVTLRCWSG